MEFGEVDFKNDVVGEFQGDVDSPTYFFNRLLSSALTVSDYITLSNKDPKRHVSAINSRDAKLNHLYSKTMTAPSHKAHIDLSTEINERMRTDHVFEQFAGEVNDEQDFPLPRDFDCLRTMMNAYE